MNEDCHNLHPVYIYIYLFIALPNYLICDIYKIYKKVEMWKRQLLYRTCFFVPLWSSA